MKNQLVKRMALLLSVAMLGLSVTACGDKAETADSTAAESAQTEEEAAQEENTEAADTAEESTEEAPAEDVVAEEAEAPAEDATEETEAPAKDAETEAAAGALTEEEYVAATVELAETLTATMTEAQEELSALDPSDVEASKEIIESMKQPFVDFAAIEAPEKYAGVQEKYKSGCEAMAKYLDLCVGMINGEVGEDAITELTDLLTVIQTDFTDAATLMAEVSAQ